MADPIELKRIRDLDEYVQLDPDDPDYIPATEISMVIDHPDWSEPKKISLEAPAGYSTLHFEKGRLTSLVLRDVEIEFSSAFSSIPIGFVNCYRLDTIGAMSVQTTVVIYDLSVTTIGLSFTIDDNESLTGVIVEYFYT